MSWTAFGRIFLFFLLLIIFTGTHGFLLFSFVKVQSPGLTRVSFAIGCMLLIYLIISKVHERRLIRIETGLSKEAIRLIIENLQKQNKWSRANYNPDIFIYRIKSHFGYVTHKLVIVIEENDLLINCRQIGSSKGRFPNFYGFVSWRTQDIIDYIRNASSQIKVS